MALWSFAPQQVLTMEVDASHVTRQRVGQVADVIGVTSLDARRRFRLQYAIVSTTDATSMAAFWTLVQGGFRAFDWLNPNDSRVYQVVLEQPEMTLELFTPVFWRQGVELVFTTVQS